MERVTGRSLADIVEARGLPIGRILELAIPIADALAAAHERGIVHRDLKPANVMVNDEGRVKVLDYEMASGTRPFGGKSSVDVVSAIIRGTRGRSSACGPICPRPSRASSGAVSRRIRAAACSRPSICVARRPAVRQFHARRLAGLLRRRHARGAHHRSREAGRRIAEALPAARMVHDYLGDVLWLQGRFGEAIAEYRQSHDPGSDEVRLLDDAFRRSGPQAAIKTYADYLAAHARAGSNAMAVAEAYAQAGARDQAFEWLERAYADRQPQLLHVVALPFFDGLRDGPRYQDLIRRIGIPATR